MFDFITTILQDLHPISVHLPIGLLLVSYALSFAARLWPQLDESSWLLLILGGLSTIPATVTGLLAHFPYEEHALIAVIEPHQFLGIGTTLFTLALLIWRWLSRRAGRDIGQRPIYLVAAFIGLLLLVTLGGTGGQLTYEYGINVRGVNPLLP
jgi:uncharacterized membrane protein